MRIEAYFDQLRAAIEGCPVVQLTTVTYATRSTFTGFAHGELHFIDQSVLHLREYVDVETTVERLMYSYQYMDTSGKLIFRYDNTGHHKKLNLPTYPHHQHAGSEENVIASPAPMLADVLREVEQRVQLP